MYLFKNIQNKWIFGTTIYDECPSGQYRVIYSSDFTKLSIRYMSDGTFVEQNRDVSYFKDSNGDPYANYISFSTSTDGFFANSPSSEAELAMSLAIGSKADVVAITDTGTFSLISLIKRALQGITTIFTRQTDGTQKTQVVDQNGHPLRSPDYVDCTSTVNVVYRGFNIGQGNTLSINKVDLTDTTNITRTWGTGTWANRASITYS